jgi:hypothetical protein
VHNELPSWQADHVNGYFGLLSADPQSGYNANGRGYPDISYVATYYSVIIGGEEDLAFGTSASSPVLGGLLMLINAERAEIGLGPVGFINPTLYSANSSMFNDVTSGNNSCCAYPSTVNPGLATCCSAGFQSAVGWDPVTGLGSMDYPMLRELFASIPSPTATPTEPTSHPTVMPTARPSTLPTPAPSAFPTTMPSDPSAFPTTAPSDPTVHPTPAPSTNPTVPPSSEPTLFPTIHPSARPTRAPTFSPTETPTTRPTRSPTFSPSTFYSDYVFEIVQEFSGVDYDAYNVKREVSNQLLAETVEQLIGSQSVVINVTVVEIGDGVRAIYEVYIPSYENTGHVSGSDSFFGITDTVSVAEFDRNLRNKDFAAENYIFTGATATVSFTFFIPTFPTFSPTFSGKTAEFLHEQRNVIMVALIGAAVLICCATASTCFFKGSAKKPVHPAGPPKVVMVQATNGEIQFLQEVFVDGVKRYRRLEMPQQVKVMMASPAEKDVDENDERGTSIKQAPIPPKPQNANVAKPNQQQAVTQPRNPDEELARKYKMPDNVKPGVYILDTPDGRLKCKVRKDGTKKYYKSKEKPSEVESEAKQLEEGARPQTKHQTKMHKRVKPQNFVPVPDDLPPGIYTMHTNEGEIHCEVKENGEKDYFVYDDELHVVESPDKPVSESKSGKNVEHRRVSHADLPTPSDIAPGVYKLPTDHGTVYCQVHSDGRKEFFQMEVLKSVIPKKVRGSGGRKVPHAPLQTPDDMKPGIYKVPTNHGKVYCEVHSDGRKEFYQYDEAETSAKPEKPTWKPKSSASKPAETDMIQRKVPHAPLQTPDDMKPGIYKMPTDHGKVYCEVHSDGRKEFYQYEEVAVSASKPAATDKGSADRKKVPHAPLQTPDDMKPGIYKMPTDHGKVYCEVHSNGRKEFYQYDETEMSKKQTEKSAVNSSEKLAEKPKSSASKPAETDMIQRKVPHAPLQTPDDMKPGIYKMPTDHGKVYCEVHSDGRKEFYQYDGAGTSQSEKRPKPQSKAEFPPTSTESIGKSKRAKRPHKVIDMPQDMQPGLYTVQTDHGPVYCDVDSEGGREYFQYEDEVLSGASASRSIAIPVEDSQQTEKGRSTSSWDSARHKDVAPRSRNVSQYSDASNNSSPRQESPGRHARKMLDSADAQGGVSRQESTDSSTAMATSGFPTRQQSQMPSREHSQVRNGHTGGGEVSQGAASNVGQKPTFPLQIGSTKSAGSAGASRRGSGYNIQSRRTSKSSAKSPDPRTIDSLFQEHDDHSSDA